MAVPPRQKIKVTTNIQDDEVAELRRQAAEDGISLTEAIRRSINVGKIAHEVKQHRVERDGAVG